MTEAGIAAIGVVLTFGLFHLISVSWPRLYYGPSDSLAIFLSSSLVKFSLFRILPVAVATSIAAAYAIKIDLSALWTSVLYFAIYVLSLCVFRVVNRYRNRRRVSLRDVLWLTVASSFTLLGTVAGWSSSPFVESILPDLWVSRDALFTALLVAAVVGFMQRMRLDKDISERAMRRAIRDNRLLIDSVEVESRRRGVGRWLISSIVVAEQMQRPKWFQTLEGLLYAAGMPVTVGPFQGLRWEKGNLEEQARNFVRGSPAVEFATQVSLGEEWNARGVELAVYALHNDADPFVNLCFQVRKMLIGLEFPAASTPHEIDSLGIEFSYIQVRVAVAGEFSFNVHLRSDVDHEVHYILCALRDLPNASYEVLTPGESLEVQLHGSEVDVEWVFRSEAEGVDNVRFRPIRDLEFKSSWEG